jgi:hypothetical protein
VKTENVFNVLHCCLLNHDEIGSNTTITFNVSTISELVVVPFKPVRFCSIANQTRSFNKILSALVIVTMVDLPFMQGGSNMTGTNCDLFTHNQSRSYLNHLVPAERPFLPL